MEQGFYPPATGVKLDHRFDLTVRFQSPTTGAALPRIVFCRRKTRTSRPAQVLLSGSGPRLAPNVFAFALDGQGQLNRRQGGDRLRRQALAILPRSATTRLAGHVGRQKQGGSMRAWVMAWMPRLSNGKTKRPRMNHESHNNRVGTVCVVAKTRARLMRGAACYDCRCLTPNAKKSAAPT